MPLGAVLGLTMVSPFSNEGSSLESATVGTATGLILVPGLSAPLGGYPAGRLHQMGDLHTNEVFFRETATASSPGRWRDCSSPAC